MHSNFLKEKIGNNEVTLGAWVGIGHPEITEILSELDFNWLLMDTEHSPLSTETVQLLMQAMNRTNVTPLVRVAWNDSVLIKKALDIGAQGVMVPHVNTKDDAKKAVLSCKYPPKGIRGVGPRRASVYYIKQDEYLERVDEIMTIVQIETEDSVRNIDDILTVDGVDAFFIGPYDLSASMGVLGQTSNSRVQESIAKVLESGKKHGVYPGIWSGSTKKANQHIQEGFKFIALGEDIEFLVKGCTDTISGIRR